MLLRASRWFDRQLLQKLEALGWPRLSGSQSLVFANLDEDGTPPAELARRLGMTRQSAGQLIAGLVHLGLIVTVPNPARRGGLLVRLSDEGHAVRRDAGKVFAGLEARLGARAETLRAALEQMPDLTAGLPGSLR